MPLKSFPSRRVRRFEVKEFPPIEELESWALKVGLKLGPVIPSKEDRKEKVPLRRTNSLL